MSKSKASILVVEHPLAPVARQIWGVNITTPANLADMPESIQHAYRVFRQAPPGSTLCTCCSEPIKKLGGVATIRMRTPDNPDTLVPTPICRACARLPPNDVTPRVIKSLTGLDRPAVEYKGPMQ